MDFYLVFASQGRGFPLFARSVKFEGLFRLAEVARDFLIDDAKELLAGVNADFGVDVADVTVGGTGGDKQRLGNERLIAPLHEQPHHLSFASGKTVALGEGLRDLLTVGSLRRHG